MLTDIALSLFALLRTSLLFRLGGSRAVARQAHQAMSVTPMSQDEILATGVDLWQTYHRFSRIKRLWPAQVLCLQTALSLQRILTAKGVRSAVRIGISREGTTLGAHAWVEVGDFVLDDTRGSSGFAAFDPPTPAARSAP